MENEEYPIFKAPQFLLDKPFDRKAKGKSKYDEMPFSKLEIGQGFFLPYNDPLYPTKTNIGAVLVFMGKRLNMKFMQRKYDETKVFIFRVDPALTDAESFAQMQRAAGSPVGTE